MLIFSDGSQYERIWKDGSMFGEGILTSTDGKSYRDAWKDGGFNIISEVKSPTSGKD